MSSKISVEEKTNDIVTAEKNIYLKEGDDLGKQKFLTSTWVDIHCTNSKNIYAMLQKK